VTSRAGDARITATGLRILAGSGLLRPGRPDRAVRAVRAAVTGGGSSATIVAVSAARWPHEPAISDESATLTYAQLHRRSEALAAGLAHEYGIGPDRALAVMGRNHKGLIEAFLAGSRLGADVVLLNTELPAPQLAQSLKRHPVGVVLHDEEFTGRFAAAEYSAPRLLSWVDENAVGQPTAQELIARDWHGPRRPSRSGRLILLTSGTTGVPKGVPRVPSPKAVFGVALTAIDRMRLRPNETIVIAPPLFHGLGIAAATLGLALGDMIVLRRRFDPTATLSAIEAEQAAVLIAVPVMLQRLLAEPDVAIRARSLRAVLSGGAPLSPVLAAQFMDAVGDVLYNGYGSSEVGIATLATPADLRAAPGTIGRAVLGTPVSVLDEQGRPVGPGTVGRVFVGGHMTFDGYTGGGNKETVGTLMATGDLGHADDAGRLIIDGRVDDMIVSGGENVFPQGVEDALASHPAVADVAVIGVSDPEFGQRLRAFIVLTAAAPDEAELFAYLRERLTRYEIPRDLVFVKELPRNATGKVLRSKLASEGVPA
jgi:acyl-CoA synthetase (AMP-forming)/AMP-acid ligase II